MSDWNRKQLLTLTDEIHTLLLCDALPQTLRARLKEIYDVAKNNSKYVSATEGDVTRVRKELSACKADPNWGEFNSLLLDSLEQKRNSVLKAVTFSDADSTKSLVNTEYVMSWFSQAQVIVAELFAREEEVFRLIGLPDSELRRHIVEHNKIIDIFNDVYIDAMAHKQTMAAEVCEKLKVEIHKHFSELDSTLRCDAGNKLNVINH